MSRKTVIPVPKATEAFKLKTCHCAVPYLKANQCADFRGTGIVPRGDGTFVLEWGQRFRMGTKSPSKISGAEQQQFRDPPSELM